MERVSSESLLIHSAVEKMDGNMIEYLHSEGRNINERDSKKCTPLHRAAYNGCKNIAEVLLRLGADQRMENYEDNRAIHLACLKGSTDVVKLLLDNGCDINIKGHDYNTPLHFAIYNGWSKVAVILLERGCDVNTYNIYGFTPLHIAARIGDLNNTELLLKFGANTHSVTSKGNTALHLAVESGEKDISTILLTYGSDIHATNNFYSSKTARIKYWLESIGLVRPLSSKDIFCPNSSYQEPHDRTVFHIAAVKGHCEIMKELIQHSLKVDKLNREDWNAIIYCMANGNLTDLESIFECYEPLENHSNVEESPTVVIDFMVHRAILKNRLEELEDLCSQGADLNSVDEHGFTPLHLAVFMKNTSIASVLLKSGAYHNVAIQNFIYPIHIACLHGLLDIVQLLLEYKCDIHIHSLLDTFNFRNMVSFKLENQFTFVCKRTDLDGLDQFSLCPLHLAVGRGDSRLAEILLENGASTKCINFFGNTPLHAAIKWNEYNITASLLKHDNNFHVQNVYGQTPLHLAAEFGRHDILARLLEENNSSDLHIQDKQGYTALHVAAKEGHINTLEVLLKHGFNIDCLNEERETALHVAVMNNKQDVIELLLKHNADPYIQDGDGDTAINWALTDNKSHTLKALLEGRINPNTVDSMGNTLLHLVHDDTSLRLLLRYGADINIVNRDNETALETAL